MWNDLCKRRHYKRWLNIWPWNRWRHGETEGWYGKEEVAHYIDFSSDSVSPGERMWACNPIIHVSWMYISMNNALKIGICCGLQSENLVLNSYVEDHVFGSEDWLFSHICQTKCQLLHVTSIWGKTDSSFGGIFSFSNFFFHSPSELFVF